MGKQVDAGPAAPMQGLARFALDDAPWKACQVVLKDAEQSVVLIERSAEGQDGEQRTLPVALVGGLHEATVDIVGGAPTASGKAVRLNLRSSPGHPSDTRDETKQGEEKAPLETAEVRTSVLRLAFEDGSTTPMWVARLKRASFPPGALWASRPQQDISKYAISRLECDKVGSVWKAEGTRTSVLIDSLQLCSRNALKEQSGSPESLLLLLRLKTFGCTLSMDRVAAEFDEPVCADVALLKSQTLRELLAFVSEAAGSGIMLDGQAFSDFMEMIAINLLRPLHVFQAGNEMLHVNGRLNPARLCKPGAGLKPPSEETPHWDHLALLYELLLKLVGSNVCELETKKRCVREQFCRDFLQLFRSSDAREREYVKTITHCMYSRLVSHRGAMRQGMANALLEFVYVSRHHAGVAEMLEVYGSVASGFATPIKQEHRVMLFRCLLPLYSARGAEFFQEQLSFVLLQFMTKEPELVVPVLLALLKYWPKRSAAKQILFLGEVGEVVGFMEPRHFEAVRTKLVRRLCACISGPHFQVAEYAMGLLNNNYLYAMIFESADGRRDLIPDLLFALRSAAASWNPAVKQIGNDIIDFLRTLDYDLFLESESLCLVREEKRARSSSDALGEELQRASLAAAAAKPGPREPASAPAPAPGRLKADGAAASQATGTNFPLSPKRSLVHKVSAARNQDDGDERRAESQAQAETGRQQKGRIQLPPGMAVSLSTRAAEVERKANNNNNNNEDEDAANEQGADNRPGSWEGPANAAGCAAGQIAQGPSAPSNHDDEQEPDTNDEDQAEDEQAARGSEVAASPETKHEDEPRQPPGCSQKQIPATSTSPITGRRLLAGEGSLGGTAAHELDPCVDPSGGETPVM